MLQFVHEGGAGMMPVLVAGLTQLVLACVLVARPKATTLALTVGAAVTTLLSGAMGTLMGVRACVALGVLETELGHSLHPIILAVSFTSLAVFPATVGGYRLARGTP